jgi:CTP:molybdopterin cytidylyltransferase MocA
VKLFRRKVRRVSESDFPALYGPATSAKHPKASGARPSRSAAAPRSSRRRRGTRVAAVVLAAGEASRFGSPKQVVLLPLVLERLVEAPVDEIVIVAGAHELDPPSNTVLQGKPARIVRCPEWADGPGASLRCGLASLAANVAAAVVVLADGPNLASAAVDRVLNAWVDSGEPVVAASYSGGRGHPLVLARSAWTDIPDEGLKGREILLVPCDDLGAPGDVDLPEDLPPLPAG